MERIGVFQSFNGLVVIEMEGAHSPYKKQWLNEDTIDQGFNSDIRSS